ncbi:ADP-ribosylation factor-like protein 6-interacting protein 1 isoform X2 [Penaeus japonicus]|uniref:ADP-ribosylation factor-like protein 6-interacting protein 1 isoform X2 n=1 Tax=Penaeus japonicus TaxID=27405 RepID=UPI001C715CF3|nr:ADP-ribosylation factor-like protein 6-interacting protein 1 isoform X2 [Penaeus japonicus]
MDLDRRVKTLRRELEGWREVLYVGHSVLVWEKQYYPFISISAVSALFLMIWYLEPSMLTLLSVLGITVTLCDYLVPQIVPWIVGAVTGQEHTNDAMSRSSPQLPHCVA